MLYAVPMQCPKCRSWVDALSFAHKVDGMYFHVCPSCIGTIVSLDDVLRVGYNTGFGAGVEWYKERLNEEK